MIGALGSILFGQQRSFFVVLVGVPFFYGDRGTCEAFVSHLREPGHLIVNVRVI